MLPCPLHPQLCEVILLQFQLAWGSHLKPGRKEASRGFEPRSLDSESRVPTVTPRGRCMNHRQNRTSFKLAIMMPCSTQHSCCPRETQILPAGGMQELECHTIRRKSCQYSMRLPIPAMLALLRNIIQYESICIQTSERRMYQQSIARAHNEMGCRSNFLQGSTSSSG